MGSTISYWWWGGNPDEENPVSGLTRREVYAVQNTWKSLYADCIATGTEIFIRLFRLKPEAKQAFKMIRNLPEEELRKNFQFQAHVINLMSALDSSIKNLNQPEIVAAMMNKLGESHGKRKVKTEHFLAFKDVLKQLLLELHTNKLTTQAWEKTVDFMYKNIFETLVLNHESIDLVLESINTD